MRPKAAPPGQKICCGADALLAVRGADCDGVYPAAMAIVASHNRGHDLDTGGSDKKEAVVHRSFLVDNRSGRL